MPYKQRGRPRIKGWSPLEEVEQELYPDKKQLTPAEWERVLAAAKDRLYERTGYRIPP